jgi:hypothetical protein
MATTGNQNVMRLAFGVSRNDPKPAPAKVLRQVESAAQALAISIRAGNHKLAYIGQCVGKSEGYVSRMASGQRPIPRKLVKPLCAATGSLLLQQFHDLEDAMHGVDEVTRLADLLREAA